MPEPPRGERETRRGSARTPTSRVRQRPSTRHTRKLTVAEARASRPTAPDQTADNPADSLSVEIHPIGGLFGTATADLEPGAGRLGKMSRAILRRRRRQPVEPSLLEDLDFRVLWWSRLISQTAQGALLYSLLILVVDLSDRTVYNSLFVICSIIPSLMFGLPAGIVVDTFSRKTLLVSLNAFRFLFMLFLVAAEPSMGGVFAATLGIWIIHQFYSPAEASELADIVPRHRYTSAQAMFNLALTISQALGLIIVAPILLRLGGPRLVFMTCGALYVVAIALTSLLPTLDRGRSHYRRAGRTTMRKALGDGWRFARGDKETFEAMIDDVLVGIGMSALVVIMPFYLERVLGTSKENTVFVFAPAALGLVAGLRIAPRLGRIIGEQRSATGALLLFAFCVAALGFVDTTYAFLNDTLRFPLDQITETMRISPQISVAMMVSIPAGVASAVVNVSARSVLLARTPSTVRGQVIATQSLIGNIGSLLPTLLAGIATDIFGVKPIAVAIAIVIVAAAMAARAFGRRSMHVALATQA